MDSLFYFLNFLRFKAPDRIWLTKRITLSIFLAIALLYLINLFAQFFLFNYLLWPQEFLTELAELLLFGPKVTSIWAPEIVLVAVFGAVLLLLLAIAWPSLSECICSLITPCCLKLKDLDLDNCLNSIDFQGKVTFEPEERALLVTNSGSGMLFHRMLFNYYWKDFEAIFEFKFVGEKDGESLKTSYEITKLESIYCTLNNYLGFIFRAKDLDNYFMLSIGAKKYQKRKCIPKCDEDNLEGKEILLITPHIRIGGMWEVFESKIWKWSEVPQFRVKDYNAARVAVRGTRLDLWLGKLVKKRGQECQEIKEEKHLLDWYLPTNYSINWRDRQNQEQSQKDKGYNPGDSSIIPFRNSIGRIGFRAYGDEKFLVRNLIIKKVD